MRRCSRSFAFVLAAAGALTLLGTGCERRAPTGAIAAPAPGAAERPPLRVAIDKLPGVFDPHAVIMKSDVEVALNLFEGLTAISADGLRPLPGAAERWDVSADGLVYTFHLRADAAWSDGRPLTADDFAFAFRRLADPQRQFPRAFTLRSVRNLLAFRRGELADFAEVGVRAPDPRTLVLELESPDPFLLHQLALPGGYPRRHDIAWPATDAPEDAKSPPPVTNGAYIVESREEKALHLRRNAHFHAAGSVALERIELVVSPGSEWQPLLFRADKLDISTALPAAALPAAREREALRTFRIWSLIYFAFNVEQPPFDDARVRRALNLAIDRAALARAIGEPPEDGAWSVVPPLLEEYRSTARLAFDPAQARALLAEAGYPGGEGMPVVRLVYMIDEAYRRAAEFVQASLKNELGLRVHAIPLIGEKTDRAIEERRYDLVSTGLAGTVLNPMIFVSSFVSHSPFNTPRWNDSAYTDAAVAAGRLQGAERIAAIQQLEARLLEASPLMPLLYGRAYYLVDPELAGWAENPADLHPLRFLRWR